MWPLSGILTKVKIIIAGAVAALLPILYILAAKTERKLKR